MLIAAANPALFQTPDCALSVALGSFLSLNENGCPLIDFEGNESGVPQVALSCVPLNAENAGCEVAVGFLNGDPQRPIVLGLIQRRAETKIVPVQSALPAGVEVKISADQELVLQCGKASITLTRDGKIVVSGEYVVSRSYGVNQIQGASVQIN